MFYHNKCQKEVFATGFANIYFQVGVTDKGIKIIVGDIFESQEPEISFSCVHCREENLPLSEINSICSHTRKFLPITELYKITNVGGFYCKEAIDELFPDRRRLTLQNLLRKIDNE